MQFAMSAKRKKCLLQSTFAAARQPELANQKSVLGQLTDWQHEILQLIAESQNTKEISEISISSNDTNVFLIFVLFLT